MPESRTLTTKFTIDKAKSRAAGTTTIVGHAAIFNSFSHDLGGFSERVAPGAFKRALANPKTDAVLNYGHGVSMPIARQSAGNLVISEDQRGLKIEATPPPTSTARELMQLIEAGVLNQMSFKFTIEDESWSQDAAGKPTTTINQVRDLYDVSIVDQGAYPGTDVDARSLSRRTKVLSEPGPYERGEAGISFFSDLARVTALDKRREALQLHPSAGNLLRSDQVQEEGIPSPVAGGIEAARKRLSTVERAHPSLAEGEGGQFAPKSTPANVAAAFVTSATPAAAMASLLGVEPIPRDASGRITIPAIVTGATVSSVSEGSAISNTDFTTTSHSGTPIYIAGESEISQQALDLSNPGLDEVIAAELGNKLGAEFDRQLINGSGSTQLNGVLGTSGIGSVTWTQASPTGPLLFPQLGKLVSTVNTNLGHFPNAILAHGRRVAWLASQEDSSGAPLIYPANLPPLTVVNSLPTNLGTSTSEDRLIALDTSQVKVYADPPVFKVMADPKSSTLQVRLRIHQAVIFIVRQPLGLAVMSGEGLKAPTFP